MSKDVTEVLTAGPNTHLWLAPVATAEPADFSTGFSGSWVDMGYLTDPPAIARAITTADLDAWNAEEPLRTLISADVSTVQLKLLQTSRATFELYFGPLIYTTEGSGISIEPNPAGATVEKVMCLELVDGTNVLRVYWRRCTVDSVGAISMAKAAGIDYDVTLKRLVPVSGQAYRIQTNVLGLVSA